MVNIQSMLAGRQALLADRMTQVDELRNMTAGGNAVGGESAEAGLITAGQSAKALATRIQAAQMSATAGLAADGAAGNPATHPSAHPPIDDGGFPPPPHGRFGDPAALISLSEEATTLVESESQSLSGTLGRGKANLDDDFAALEQKMASFLERAGLSEEVAQNAAAEIADSARAAYDQGYKTDIGLSLTQAEISETISLASNSATGVSEANVDRSGYLATAELTLSVDPSTGAFSANFSQMQVAFEENLSMVVEDGWTPLDALAQQDVAPPPLAGDMFAGFNSDNMLLEAMEEMRTEIRAEFESQVLETIAPDKKDGLDVLTAGPLASTNPIAPGNVLIRGLENGQKIGDQTESGMLAMKAEIALVVGALDMPFGMPPLSGDSGGSFGGGAFGAYQAASYSTSAYAANQTSQRAVGLFA